MLYRNLLVILFVFAKFHSYQGCTTTKNKVDLPCKEYDLNKPVVLKLGDPLAEISGISFYPKDSSVFAISDNNGNIYKIHLNKNTLTEKWKFDIVRDFEEVLLHDSSFFVLEGNGNIQAFNFSVKGDTIFKRKNIFPAGNKKKNEFESMYYDEESKRLIVICKNCEAENKNSVSAWSLDPASGSYTPSVFSIDVNAIAKKTGTEQKLQPSAAAINPLTNDVWILASMNQLLIVTDRKGNTKEVFTLNPLIFNQPEGITFTTSGDMLISNEVGDKYDTPTLLFFKLQKRG